MSKLTRKDVLVNITVMKEGDFSRLEVMLVARDELNDLIKKERAERDSKKA